MLSALVHTNLCLEAEGFLARVYEFSRVYTQIFFPLEAWAVLLAAGLNKTNQ